MTINEANPAPIEEHSANTLEDRCTKSTPSSSKTRHELDDVTSVDFASNRFALVFASIGAVENECSNGELVSEPCASKENIFDEAHACRRVS